MRMGSLDAQLLRIGALLDSSSPAVCVARERSHTAGSRGVEGPGREVIVSNNIPSESLTGLHAQSDARYRKRRRVNSRGAAKVRMIINNPQ